MYEIESFCFNHGTTVVLGGISVVVRGMLLLFFRLKQVRMYYRSGTDGRCCVGAEQTLCVHLPGGSTLMPDKLLPDMTSWPPSLNYDVKSDI